jgi:hypothetical protein
MWLPVKLLHEGLSSIPVAVRKAFLTKQLVVGVPFDTVKACDILA